MLCAHGRVGQTQYLFDNPPPRPPKFQKRFNTDGQKLGEFEGENFCPSAEAKPRRPARSEQRSAKKFSFPFRRKRNRAPNQNTRRKLFCGTASEASGGGAERSFVSEISAKISSSVVV